jgi:TonB-dependent SusC/RagA subfamily outer membrane receptor
LEILKPVKVEQALQGTVSGVNVTSTSGAPGAKLDIHIRLCYKRRKRTNNNYRWVCWRIRFVKSNDIETITVLKDAQAAIYGTIGANGVILITTKTGKEFKAKNQFQFLYRFSGNNKVAWLVECHRVCIIAQ